jgi:hypothetical protein
MLLLTLDQRPKKAYTKQAAYEFDDLLTNLNFIKKFQ